LGLDAHILTHNLVFSNYLIKINNIYEKVLLFYGDDGKIPIVVRIKLQKSSQMILNFSANYPE